MATELFSNFLAPSPEVQRALHDGKPVVALESTIIAHGMPYPKNVETALRVEQVVRAHGAVPATCAIVRGQLKAGLSHSEIEYLGQSGAAIPKASRRDIAYLLSQKRDGATTVASTMIIAHLCGISVFATGGIGGVHRGAGQSFDISADLQELAQTPVAVVCAGVKSILDIGLTLEYLETFGVPVLGFQTAEFPAFYSRKSGFQVDYRMDSPEAITQLLKAQWALGFNGGAVIANPVPAEHELEFSQMEQAIEKALRAAEEKRVKGKAITPFLLAEIERLTGGESLAANIELVCNNAGLAAEVAGRMG